MLGAMDNPYVKIIGHPEDGNIPVDYVELVKHARETGTMLEVNNSSLKTAYYRLNVRENLMEMLQLCENTVFRLLSALMHILQMLLVTLIVPLKFLRK